MRRYWDERARENAVFYVDTSLAYGAPDMERFWATGRTVVDEALLRAPVQPAGRDLAVEIGAGLGRICVALAEHFDHVIGIDVSPEMVHRARGLVAHPRVRFEVGDGVSLAAVADASADLVLSFTVFQHQTDRSTAARYLAEAGRVLRAGGVVAVQWNNDAHPRRYAVRAWWLRAKRRLGLLGDERAAAPFLGRPLPLPFMTDVLSASGLDPIGTRGEGTLFAWIWAVKR